MSPSFAMKPRSSRRTFLAQLLAASMLSPLRADTLDRRVGIQLWALNAEMMSDPARALHQLRSIGYREVESIPFNELSATQLRRLIDDADLKCPSAHLDFLGGKLERLIEEAHSLGAKYATSSLLRWGTGALLAPGANSRVRAMTLDDARRTADLANRMGEKLKRAGLRYAYHNHDFEFVPQGNGAIGYDLLLEETDPGLVDFEMDCGWMKVAGYDPVAYIKRHPGRFPMLHIKDFQLVAASKMGSSTGAQRLGTELGRGFIDYEPILAASKEAGVKHYFTEQEGPFTRMGQLEAARVNYEYLRALGG
jgi:sugar phosphate isomerase/epimerase